MDLFHHAPIMSSKIRKTRCLLTAPTLKLQHLDFSMSSNVVATNIFHFPNLHNGVSFHMQTCYQTKCSWQWAQMGSNALNFKGGMKVSSPLECMP